MSLLENYPAKVEKLTEGEEEFRNWLRKQIIMGSPKRIDQLNGVEVGDLDLLEIGYKAGFQDGRHEGFNSLLSMLEE